MKHPELLEDILATLNESLLADPKATKLALLSAFPCNQKLIDHPTIQCRETSDGSALSALGLINGFVERITGERVAVVINDDDTVREFTKYCP